MQHRWEVTPLGLSILGEAPEVQALNQGLAANHQGDVRRAITLYRQAQASVDLEVKGTALFREAQAQETLRDDRRHRGCVRQARYCADLADSDWLRMLVLRLEAFLQDGPNDALRLMEGSLTLARRLGCGLSTSAALSNIGVLSTMAGLDDDALRAYEEADAIDRAEGRQALRAYNLNGIAIIFRDQGLLTRSAEVFEEALQIVTSMGPAGMHVKLMCNLHNVLVQLGHDARARSLTQSIVDSIQANGRETNLFGECPICLETLGEGSLFVDPMCWHAHHTTCLVAQRYRCPLCNT